MGRRKERDKYFIPVDGKLYETSEEIYVEYYKMKNHEEYQDKQKKINESSYEELEGIGFQIEWNSSADKRSAEDNAITSMMIEKMLRKLSVLSEYELWLIEEVYSQGKSDRQLENETGINRSTIGVHRRKILAKLRKELKE
jgi:DNA-directed RNA polymerase specialized sigma subunit